MNLCLKSDNKLFKNYVLCLDECDIKYTNKLNEHDVNVEIIKKKHKFDILFFIHIIRYIRSQKIDTIHVHSGCFFYAAIFYLFSGVKNMICTAHGMPVLNRFRDVIEDNISYIICKNFIGVSDEITSFFANRLFFSDKKISLIVNGIDIETFKPVDFFEKNKIKKELFANNDEFLIGSVGRLVSVKNYSMLIRSFAVFHEKMPMVPKRLVFIGDGPERSALEELSLQLGIRTMVTFLGNCYDVQRMLPMLDAFVLSSKSEGTSISLLEAQACGIPAIVTDVGGNGFIVRHNENGFLCAVDDVEAMATDLCKLYDEPETVKSMADAARRRVLDGLSLDCMIRQYQDLYLRAF
jgi:Glycosyltransferase